MPFELETFCVTRPFAYHLTAAANLDRIRSLQTLFSAAILMEQANDVTWLDRRRLGSKELTCSDGDTVILRDQDPLHAGNVRLDGGWDFEDYVRILNSRVFFWPGTIDGPIQPGQNHFRRYEREGPAIIRVDTRELFRANDDAEPEFAKYNTGAPRCNAGKASPRGPSTFLAAQAVDFTPSSVVELTFCDSAYLPAEGVKWRRLGRRNWQRLV